MVDDDRAAYVALALAPGIGPVRLGILLHHCKTATGALEAPVAFLGSLPGLNRAAADAIHGTSPRAGAVVLEQVAAMGGRCLLPADPGYPALLRQLPDAPALLFAIGRLELLDRPAVAIVGSRDPTTYGLTVCHELASGASRAGLLVVSGMARGLDAAAHQAALGAGGGTAGILGNGFGVIYPAANRELYERVRESGVLLTEHPPGERPHAGSFPRRNRLISGLVRLTVVVEAAAGSGALITAATALDQGREVMAVPGAITSPRSTGTNRLIVDGAAPVLGLDDILRHYPEVASTVPVNPHPPSPPEPARVLPADLTDPERRICEALTDGALPVDLAIERARLPASLGLAAISALELRGTVAQRSGRLLLEPTRPSP
jgi:DNA processing protein